MQADVELDQQRGARAVPAERRRQPLGGGDAVDGDRQLHAVRRDAGEPVALLRAERRVVDEDARRAGLVEDLRLAGLGDGQAARAELDLAHADLWRLVRLRVRPELDAVLVGVGLQASQVRVQAVEVDHRDRRLDVPQGPADLLGQQVERPLGRRGLGSGPQRAQNNHPLLRPPSAMNDEPVTKLASSDARKATTAAISCGAPMRPSACALFHVASRVSASSDSASIPSVTGVRMIPGQIAFTRIRAGASSSAESLRERLDRPL